MERLAISFTSSLTSFRYIIIFAVFSMEADFPFKLYGPLNQLGYIYRSVNQSLVDTEKLLDLLNEPTDVNDKKDAPDLIVDTGETEFGRSSCYHVCFNETLTPHR